MNARPITKAIFSAVFLVVVADAATIVSVTVPSPGGSGLCITSNAFGGNCPGAAAASWSETSTYSGVSISAFIFDQFSVGGTLDAWLTTGIGPGTTAAAQVAHATVSVPVGVFGQVNLFSGLTLGPGTYYLSLHGDPLDWGMNPNSNVVLAAGVAQLADYSTTPCCQGSFVPAESFLAQTSTVRLSYIVTGDLVNTVPEPSSAVPIGICLTGLVYVIRRRLG
jgi:hypothetical protein